VHSFRTRQSRYTHRRTHDTTRAGETAEALDIGAIEAAAQAVPLGRKVPLNEQFGVPPPPSTTKVDKTVRHTTLDNGVRVGA
jgi:hypothetical protein